jgi:hypothetical protein
LGRCRIEFPRHGGVPKVRQDLRGGEFRQRHPIEEGFARGNPLKRRFEGEGLGNGIEKIKAERVGDEKGRRSDFLGCCFWTQCNLPAASHKVTTEAGTASPAGAQGGQEPWLRQNTLTP